MNLYCAVDYEPMYWDNDEYAQSLMRSGSPHTRLRCREDRQLCARCKTSKDVFHVCPICGNTLPKTGHTSGDAICSCGTWLLICSIGGAVAGYVAGNPLYKESMDDTI